MSKSILVCFQSLVFILMTFFVASAQEALVGSRTNVNKTVSQFGAEPSPKLKAETTAAVCKTNRTAPPMIPYSWPPDSTVRVYFVRGVFSPEQRQVLFAAMSEWSEAAKGVGAGVSFVNAGESDRRVGCKQCLTIDRKDPHTKDQGFYASFFPVSYDRHGSLRTAWIEFDDATTNPEALQGYMAHELGHSMGLGNCPSCKKKHSVMNSFPGANRNNGLISPSPCDLEVVRRVYDDQRRLATTRSEFDTGIRPGGR